MSNDNVAAQVDALRSDIEGLKQDETAARAKADELKATYVADGIDLVSDAEKFDEVDKAYRAADGFRELLVDKQDQMSRAARLASLQGVPQVQSVQQPGVQVKRATGGRAAEFLANSTGYQQVLAHYEANSAARIGDIDLGEFLSRDEADRVFRAATVEGQPLIPEDQQLVPPIALPQRPPRLYDFLNQSQTDREVIEWARELANNVDATVANTAYGTAAPEATITFERVTTNVRRIPVSIPATKGDLMDQPALRNILSTRLVDGIRRHVESQALAGDGTGENFEGIATASGTATQALGVDTRADAIHKGMTAVRVALLDDDITMIGMHPTDYEEIALAKDSAGMYVNLQGPQSPIPRQLWGYPVVTSTVFTAGTAWVGNWARGATLWNRTGISVAASDSHSDFFTKGLVMLLAERRAGFAVTEPKAFCSVTGI